MMKKYALITIVLFIAKISLSQVGFLGYHLYDKKNLADTTRILNSLEIDTTMPLEYQKIQREWALRPFINENSMNNLELHDTLFGLNGELTISYTKRNRVYEIRFEHEFEEEISKKKIHKIISLYLTKFEKLIGEKLEGGEINQYDDDEYYTYYSNSFLAKPSFDIHCRQSRISFEIKNLDIYSADKSEPFSLKGFILGEKINEINTISTSVGGLEGKLSCKTLSDGRIWAILFIPYEYGEIAEFTADEIDAFVELVEKNYDVIIMSDPLRGYKDEFQCVGDSKLAYFIINVVKASDDKYGFGLNIISQELRELADKEENEKAINDF